MLSLFSLEVILRWQMELQVWILCNDCNDTTEVYFHIIGQKCSHCRSYNTRVTGPPVLPQWLGFKSSNCTGQGGMTEAFMLCLKWQGCFGLYQVSIYQFDHSTMFMYHYTLLYRIFLNHTFFLQIHGVEAQLTGLWGSVSNSKIPTWGLGIKLLLLWQHSETNITYSFCHCFSLIPMYCGS